MSKISDGDRRSLAWLDDAWRDVGYAARTLARAPGFTVVAILTLALGIGAITIIYSVVRSVLFEPFPYPAPRRMVDIMVLDGDGRRLRGPIPPAEYLDYREYSDVFESAAGTTPGGVMMHYVGADRAERLAVAVSTPDMFAYLGVQPLRGRYFGPADADPQSPPVAVLNHRTWLTVFGGDESVVGRAITLDGEPRTIVGIMPHRFEWHNADLWMPGALSRTMPANTPNSRRWLQARLKPGVTIAQAEAQLNTIAARRAAEYPKDHPPGSRVQVITIIDFVVGQFRSVLYTLFVAVSLLLVIACCNVANMLLARATAREREVTVRTALGATRGRIVRQMLVESVLLALGGVAAGGVLAYVGIRFLRAMMPRPGVARETELLMDPTVLAFAFAAGMLATLVFGVFPAFHSARRDLVAGVGGGRGGSASRRSRRLRRVLVVAEVAISLVLLLGAGVFLRSFLRQVDLNLGFDSDNLFVARFGFPPPPAPAPAATELHAFHGDVLARVARIPGVRQAAVTSTLPPYGGGGSAITVPGAPPGDSAEAMMQFCSEGFFETLGVSVTAGRMFSAQDVALRRQVLVVNETLARMYFGGVNPIGRRIGVTRLGTGPAALADPTFEIVGVVTDIANAGPREQAIPQIALPYTVAPQGQRLLLLRIAGEAPMIEAAVREQVRAVNAQVALMNSGTFESRLQQPFGQQRFSMFVLVIFAAAGLGLVALGVYGVISYTVSQQTREIAIRMALGGQKRHVLGQVLRMTLWLVGTGIVVGIGAGIATNRVVASQVQFRGGAPAIGAESGGGIAPHDPLTIALAGGLVLLMGLSASVVPAWRALRVQPIAALREE